MSFPSQNTLPANVSAIKNASKNEATTSNVANPSEQNSLRLRIKVGSDMPVRKNYEIYSGLGLLLSPSSSTGNDLEDIGGSTIKSPGCVLRVQSRIGELKKATEDFDNFLGKFSGLLDEIKALVQKQIDEDTIRQEAIVDLLVRCWRDAELMLSSSLERIVTAIGPGFGDWQWRLATLPFAFGGLGVYSAGDVLNYAFLASRLHSAGLQTKLLRHTGIVSPWPIFDDALSVFNTSMETDLLGNPSEIAALKLMKKMTDIYFIWVTKNAESTFSLSPRQMALWASQKEDHTS
ncbi:hypothetical protein Tco_0829936, partial [Tanacetum coccineum]